MYFLTVHSQSVDKFLEHMPPVCDHCLLITQINHQLTILFLEPTELYFDNK